MKPPHVNTQWLALFVQRAPVLFILAFLMGTLATASANPVVVDPAGFVKSWLSVLIVAVCIAVETSILCVICRLLHNADCDLRMKACIVGLNIVTLLVILMPLLRLTNSVLIAETGVVAAETIGIRKIFDLGDIKISMKRAFSYSLGVNLVSYTIGVLCQ